MKLVLTQMNERFEEIDQQFETLLSLAQQADAITHGVDIFVLPELVGSTAAVSHYEGWVSRMADELDCLVVGGSHHRPCDNNFINCGVVAEPAGEIIAQYEKSRPYGGEIDKGIVAGKISSPFMYKGRHFMVLLCADLWFSESFSRLSRLPDVVLVPAFSISQKPSPHSAQRLWQHMAVSRAYEFTTYVGVSDWTSPCTLDGLVSSGVAGFANPLPDDDNRFFTPVGDAVFRSFTLDFDRLDELRENRQERGFLWQPSNRSHYRRF